MMTWRRDPRAVERLSDFHLPDGLRRIHLRQHADNPGHQTITHRLRRPPVDNPRTCDVTLGFREEKMLHTGNCKHVDAAHLTFVAKRKWLEYVDSPFVFHGPDCSHDDGNYSRRLDALWEVEKLLARLEDTLNRHAVAHVAEITLLGPVVRASETSKRLVDVRLSAFWAHRQFHGVDIGGNFLDLLIEDWLCSNHDHVIVTVCEDRVAGQEKLFVFRDFLRISMTLDKCEKSENKVVLKWANDSLFSLSLSRRNGSSGAGVDAVTRKGGVEWGWCARGSHRPASSWALPRHHADPANPGVFLGRKAHHLPGSLSRFKEDHVQFCFAE